MHNEKRLRLCLDRAFQKEVKGTLYVFVFVCLCVCVCFCVCVCVRKKGEGDDMRKKERMRWELQGD